MMKKTVGIWTIAAGMAVSAVGLAGCNASAVNLSGVSATQTVTESEAQTEAEQDNALRVYLAGPFFNETEIGNIETAEKILEQRGFSYFSPMRYTVDAEEGTKEWARQIFELDKNEIQKADVVVAIYYASNGDTGTAWECGYASAIDKPVVLVHVDENLDSNLMMHCGCTTNISLTDLESYDFDAMPVYEYEGDMK